MAVGDLEATIQYSGGDLLKKIRLFDLYVGDQIELGKKSCAFSLEFLSRDRTLTEEEIEEITRRIVQSVGQKLGARLRS